MKKSLKMIGAAVGLVVSLSACTTTPTATNTTSVEQERQIYRAEQIANRMLPGAK